MNTHRKISRDEGYSQFTRKFKNKYTKKDIKNRAEHNKIITTFYKKVSKYIAENSEGVYVEGLGYFGVLNTGNKVNLQYQKNKEYNWETKGYVFTISFVPEYSKTLAFKSFSFDSMYSLKLRTEIRKKLESGFKYIFNPILIFKNEK